ncbi:hypothetical protein [Ferrovum myxofaciens]|uniref:hypothetical protein n=1 Tax=Ferrovum myxofaciens TaxID=416213 RepID=UPI002356B9E7|nr:hypothetical protein [Ferrovum myxofaciens]MBU6995869.1 hypothetical protein [Ferrovum myxofaciens]
MTPNVDRQATITISADRHERHHRHHDLNSVTDVMVVTVIPYCYDRQIGDIPAVTDRHCPAGGVISLGPPDARPHACTDFYCREIHDPLSATMIYKDFLWEHDRMASRWSP